MTDLMARYFDDSEFMKYEIEPQQLDLSFLSAVCLVLYVPGHSFNVCLWRDSL